MPSNEFESEVTEEVDGLFSETEEPDFFLGILGDEDGAVTSLKWVENPDAGLGNVFDAMALIVNRSDRRISEQHEEFDRGDAINKLRHELQNMLIDIETGDFNTEQVKEDADE